jgi:hypothetical protein
VDFESIDPGSNPGGRTDFFIFEIFRQGHSIFPIKVDLEISLFRKRNEHKSNKNSNWTTEK